MRRSSRSTTVTWIDGFLSARTAAVGPPTYPAPTQQILRMVLGWILFSMSLSASDVLLVPLEAPSCSSVLSSSIGLHDELRSGVVGKVETSTEACVSESNADSVESIAGGTK